MIFYDLVKFSRPGRPRKGNTVKYLTKIHHFSPLFDSFIQTQRTGRWSPSAPLDAPSHVIEIQRCSAATSYHRDIMMTSQMVM